MAKPIEMTPEIKSQYMDKMSELLDSYEPTNGRISFSSECKYAEKREAIILFSRMAFQKMQDLVSAFDSEVAWHGIGERLDEGQYYISDVVVYPQRVSGSTVDMDEEQYGKWLMDNIENDDFDHIVLQGHSHVNMAPNPSGVDVDHQEKILSMLGTDAFYIFLIWNKRGCTHTEIYDKKYNTLYENADVVYMIEDPDFDKDEFIKEAKEMVKPKVYNSTYSVYNTNNSSNHSKTANKNASQNTSLANTPASTYAGVKTKPKPSDDYINKR